MSKIAIYARKSSESEDRQVLSIDSQVRELQDFARKDGLAVCAVYTESKSAKAPGRPVFTQLIRKVQKGDLDGIICWKLDRLARNPVDGGALIWAMEEGHLNIIHTPQRRFSNTGNDKFWLQMEFGIAKKYVDDLADNVKRGLRAKIAAGWMPGVPPLGYLNDRNSRTVIPDPERFLLVRKMWDLMLTGTYTPMGVLEVATNQLGLRTRRFSRYGGGPVQYSTIYGILTNPFYYGAIRYSKELFPGSQKPMITKAEFDRVQEILGLASRPRPQEYTFAFTGLITCGECGAAITAEHKTNRRYGYKYVYYHCTRRKRTVRCSQKVIERAVLEKQISSFLRSLTISKKLRDWTLVVLRELHDEESEKGRKALKALHHRYESCQFEITELLGLRLRKILSDDEYLAKKNDLESERVRLRELLEDNDSRFDHVFRSCEDAFEFASKAQEQFDNGSLEQKRAILRHCGSNLSLKDGILSIQPEKPFKLIQNALLSHEVQKLKFEPRSCALPKAVAAPVRAGISSWFTLVKDVRTFFLLNPGRPTFKQTLAAVRKFSTRPANQHRKFSLSDVATANAT